MILETEIREFRELSRSRNTSRQVDESIFTNERHTFRFHRILGVFKLMCLFRSPYFMEDRVRLIEHAWLERKFEHRYLMAVSYL